MRALSSNSDTLLSVMEVFIHEPLLDWNKEIKSSKRQSGPNIRHKKALSGGSKDDNDEAKAGPASASQLVSESETDGSYESFASADARGELQWVPNRKIRFAKEKLHCGNPAHIMRQEFRDSAHSVVRPASLNIEKCIMGDVTAGSFFGIWRFSIPSIGKYAACLFSGCDGTELFASFTDLVVLIWTGRRGAVDVKTSERSKQVRGGFECFLLLV